MIKIYGILLVKNEDIFIEQCVSNVIDFLDKLIILDNLSTDKTFFLLKNLKKNYKHKIHLKKINSISSSHKYIEKFANKKIWILRIDGDEILDKKKLKLFRKKIIEGKFQNFWKLESAVFNCIELKNNIAKGFIGNHGSELYNFFAINSWKNCKTERLHFGEIKFKKNFNNMLVKNEKKNWNKSYFRCLHLCFLKRSSKDKNKWILNKAPFEIIGNFRLLKSQTKFFFKLIKSLLKKKIILKNLFKLVFQYKIISLRKIVQYGEGEIIKLDAKDFIKK